MEHQDNLVQRFRNSLPADAPELDVVGVDIGFVNLGLCRLRICNGRPTIVWWVMIDLLGLQERIARAACANLPRCLRPYEVCFNDCPLIVIEQQPQNNPSMRNVAHGLLTYFHTVTRTEPHLQVVMSAAVNKLKLFHARQNNTVSIAGPSAIPNDNLTTTVESHIEENADDAYEGRKEDAIEFTTLLLNEWSESLAQDPAELERLTWFKSWFNSLEKKDDAADSLLHAYYALHKQILSPRKPEAVGKLAKLNIAQIQAQLKEFGLPTSGTKAVLKARLRKAKSEAAGRSSRSLTELRAELAKLNLDTTGSKKELVVRLSEAQTLARKAKKMGKAKSSKKTTKKVKRDASPHRHTTPNAVIIIE